MDSKKEKSKEYLKYDFSKEEVADFAEELSRKIGDLELKEKGKKDVVKNIDAEIAKLEVEISSLATRVKDKYEYRMVDCEILYDYKKKKKEYKRLDTNEKFKSVPLSESELQISIDEIQDK